MVDRGWVWDAHISTYSHLSIHFCAQETPVGHPDCLYGKTFVVTGVLESLYRQDAEDAIKV